MNTNIVRLFPVAHQETSGLSVAQIVHRRLSLRFAGSLSRSRAWLASAVLLLCGGVPAQAQLVQVSTQAWTTIHAATGQEDAGYPGILGFESLSGGNIVRKFFMQLGRYGRFRTVEQQHRLGHIAQCRSQLGSNADQPA